MASVGHIIVGMAAGRLQAGSPRSWQRLTRAMFWFSVMSMLPDADVVGFVLGVRYEDPFGHRGASHALLSAPVLALLPSLLLSQYLQLRRLPCWLLGSAVVASHGLLDTMTDGGLGVALFWPWSDRRYFLPWTPIPVAPIGAGFFTLYGLHVATVEAAMFLPFLLYALWPRKKSA